MNDTDRKLGAFGALFGGLGRALQWRLLVLWAVGVLLPTWIAVLPVRMALSERLDYSVHAKAIAERFDLAWMLEAFKPLVQEQGAAINAGGITAVILTLLLSPWLTGMVVASIRAGQTLRFGNLLQFGLREYGRMARMLLWAIVPLGVAFGLAAPVRKWAEHQGDTAILQANADNASLIATIVLAVLVVFAHATLEAGRAQLAIDPSRRSAVKAWWRGVKLFFRRPVAVLVVYLGTMLIGEGLAFAFGLARTHVSAASIGGALVGVLIVQLVVAMIAWGRIARLYGLSALARDTAERTVRKVPKDVPVALATSEAANEPLAVA